MLRLTSLTTIALITFGIGGGIGAGIAGVAIQSAQAAPPGYAEPIQPRAQDPAPAHPSASPQEAPRAKTFHRRRGWYGGVGLGFGGIDTGDGSLNCAQCEQSPSVIGFDGRLGFMLTRRLGIFGEGWGTLGELDSNSDVLLAQSIGVLGLQYWIHPMVYIKGGLGFSNLELIDDNSNFSNFQDNGSAFLGALGVELISSRSFSLDLEGKLGVASYTDINETITTGTIGLGLTWH